MKTTIDARGQGGLRAAVAAQEAYDRGEAGTIEVLVDDWPSSEHVGIWARSAGCPVAIEEVTGGAVRVVIEVRDALTSESSLAMDTEEMSASLNLVQCGPVRPVMLLGSDRLGRGDDELGLTLMHSMLRAVLDAEPRPWRVLLVNHGVRLATVDPVAVDLLGLLEQRGVEVMSCGTCLSTLGLGHRPGAGRVTTMPEIVESLNRATRVTTI